MSAINASWAASINDLYLSSAANASACPASDSPCAPAAANNAGSASARGSWSNANPATASGASRASRTFGGGTERRVSRLPLFMPETLNERYDNLRAVRTSYALASRPA
jgi:hypothetical protein